MEKERESKILMFADLDLVEEHVNALMERKINDNWVHDVQAFLDYRVPALINEIRRLKKARGDRA